MDSASCWTNPRGAGSCVVFLAHAPGGGGGTTVMLLPKQKGCGSWVSVACMRALLAGQHSAVEQVQGRWHLGASLSCAPRGGAYIIMLLNKPKGHGS
jgi:hypothetical protein